MKTNSVSKNVGDFVLFLETVLFAVWAGTFALCIEVKEDLREWYQGRRAWRDSRRAKLIEIGGELPTPRRFSDNQKLVALLIGVFAAGWLFLGVPGLIDALIGHEVYPVKAFDWWWMWLFK